MDCSDRRLKLHLFGANGWGTSAAAPLACGRAALDFVHPAGGAFRTYRDAAMEKAAFLDDLQQRLASLIEGTPAADLQRNLKALLSQQFAQLELVTREEFDAQVRVLARTREKLQDLERRLAELETKRS